MRTIPRIGERPLRFKGLRLAHHTGLGDQAELFVTLWARKKGDFVVSYSAYEAGEVLPHAVAVASPDAAAEHLEEQCAHSQHDGMSAPLGVLIRGIAYRQHFSALVGAALEEWEQQLGPSLAL